MRERKRPSARQGLARLAEAAPPPEFHCTVSCGAWPVLGPFLGRAFELGSLPTNKGLAKSFSLEYYFEFKGCLKKDANWYFQICNKLDL
jgi:hypothetical protein